jgi:hypothetical protein
VKPRFGRRWRGFEAGRHEGGKYLAGRSRKGKPTSGLEPLTCSLGVISQALQGFARACKTRISKPVSFLSLAACCTVLRSRWCQSGVNRCHKLVLRCHPVTAPPCACWLSWWELCSSCGAKRTRGTSGHSCASPFSVCLTISTIKGVGSPAGQGLRCSWAESSWSCWLATGRSGPLSPRRATIASAM